MPRQDPFNKMNWKTAPVLHRLHGNVSDHFQDARAGEELAVNELVEDCMTAFRDLGITPQIVTETLNRVYGITPARTPEPPKVEPVKPETVAPAKKAGIFG